MSIMIKVCPKCGHMNPYNNSCPVCHTTLISTKYEKTKEFIRNKEFKKHLTKQIYEEYVFSSPAYDEEMFNKRIEHDEKIRKMSYSSSSSSKPTNIPKCPTCQSTNIAKITVTKKALGFAAVGIFSSNFGKTMECKNCGYKW